MKTISNLRHVFED